MRCTVPFLACGDLAGWDADRTYELELELPAAGGSVDGASSAVVATCGVSPCRSQSSRRTRRRSSSSGAASTAPAEQADQRVCINFEC